MSQWPVFNHAIRVYYENTDAGGVVYHSQYLNFMERARTEWLRSLGFEQTDLRDTLQILFVVHSMQIQFKKPAKFNDMLTINSTLSKMGLGSFECQQTTQCENQVLVAAQVKIACVNALSFKPMGIPAHIKTAMEST